MHGTDTTEDNEAIAEINIIPFVDIILVILIIFMVTVPFVIKTGFSLDLPKAGSAGKIPSTKIDITINTAGVVALNGNTLSPAELKEALKEQLKTTDPEKTQVVISADKNVLHGKVISIINIVKSTGLRKMAISAQK